MHMFGTRTCVNTQYATVLVVDYIGACHLIGSFNINRLMYEDYSVYYLCIFYVFINYLIDPLHKSIDV